MRRFVIAAAGLAACTEQGIQPAEPGGGGTGGVPDIEVGPIENWAGQDFVDFGLVDVGEYAWLEFTLANVGDGTLEVTNIYLADASEEVVAYLPSAAVPLGLEPGESKALWVEYRPLWPSYFENDLVIESGDPDEATTRIKLVGEGHGPALELSPAEAELGVSVGCTARQAIRLTNVGNADLEVTSLDLSLSSPELTLDLRTEVNGELPWTLPYDATSGEFAVIEVEVVYTPLDDVEDAAWLEVTSNDIMTPVATASVSAEGWILGENTDIFEQMASVDLLWVLRGGDSMVEERALLVDGAADLFAALQADEADYRMALITTDDPTVLGDVLRTTTAEVAASDFQALVDLAVDGGDLDLGSEMARRCLDGGDCVEAGFLREEAPLHVVYVTDEGDASSMLSGWNGLDYVDFFLSLKDDATVVQVHAIAGEPPEGCETAAPATGYSDQVTATGGGLYSACASDWSEHMTALGEAAGWTARDASFPLTDIPVAAAIEVRVDGLLVEEGWIYDEVENAVVFDEDQRPEGGATVEITYPLPDEECASGGGDPTLPVAVCTVSPGVVVDHADRATWIGADSYDPSGGSIVEYQWTLVSLPSGSAAVMPPGDADRSGFEWDLIGDYVGELVVVNDAGLSSEPCQATLTALPSDRLWVELFWAHAGDDLDLHLLAPDGEYETDTDCYYRNCADGVVLDWGVPGVAGDNPSLELDDIYGTGPENTRIADPADGVYTVMVHDFASTVYSGANDATINIYVDGALALSHTCTFTGENERVTMATVDLPSGEATVGDACP
ncbi:hypothetical protein L6R53_17845 [Myxococcota bacterium]|nr:hypothetical protein [Myxococcota bacterium]